MRIVICQYAEVHPDGTYSIVHGGLDGFAPPTVPVNLEVAAFVEVLASELEPGTLDIGWTVSGAGTGAWSNQMMYSGGRGLRFVVPVVIGTTSYGAMKLVFNVGTVSETLELEITNPTPA